MSSKPLRALLVDASPYIFRAYFALPSSITTPSGDPANASNGFASFLIRLLGEEAPTHIGVAFDGSLTTSFRNELFADYKANRDLPPPELVRQLEDCRCIAQALGVHVDISDVFEADDIIASWLAQIEWDRASDSSREKPAISIVSSDKDLGQLVRQDVDLYDFAKGTRLGPEGIKSKFGVEPHKVVDFLALAGDSVDNIPGVKGVGPKTAATLLSHLDNLESILRQPDAVKDLPLRGAAGLAAKLAANADIARLSYRLAELATDAPIAGERSTLRYLGTQADWANVCNRLGFTTLLDRGQALQPQA